MIVPLIMALISFDNYSEREFAATLGRLCFPLLCVCLAQVTSSLKRGGLPLYLDKHGAGDNVVMESDDPRAYRRCGDGDDRRGWKPRYRFGFYY